MTDKQPEKPFTMPWHAEVFAITLHLNECGHFKWTEWTKLFAFNLTEARKNNPKFSFYGDDSYYVVWLKTLIEINEQNRLLTSDMVDKFQKRWEEAYYSTPHGKPIQIKF